jgi:hypothetical protein
MSSEEIRHWRDLIAVYTKRLRVLERRAAQYGNDCPPHIQTEIEDIEEQIATLGERATNIKDVPLQPSVPQSQTFAPVVRNYGNQPEEVIQETKRIDCPYPGMIPFRTEDARLFFGRESEIEQMLLHFRYRRYLFVIGPSGSGKSSLISAGLIPRLQVSSYFPQEFWLIHTMRPGNRPLETFTKIIEGDPFEPAQTISNLLEHHSPAQCFLIRLYSDLSRAN